MTSNVNLNIINSTSTNLVTVVTSSETQSLHDSYTTPRHLTYFIKYIPPLLLSGPIINVITIPPKIWCKKATTKFKTLVYNDVDWELYFFKPFGKCTKRSPTWTPFLRSDLILWNESLDTLELLRDFCIGEYVDTSIRQSVLYIVKSNLDFFCQQGVSRSVLDFEFCIDTGDSVPVCCHQPNYEFHWRKIMNHYITALENNELITDCEGS